MNIAQLLDISQVKDKDDHFEVVNQLDLLTYYLRLATVAIVPSFGLAVLVSGLTDAQLPDGLQQQVQMRKSAGLTANLATILVIPFLESGILVYAAALAGQALRNRRLAAIVGALPIALLHSLIAWSKALFILWMFAIQAYGYLVMREHKITKSRAFCVIWAVHALNNALAVMLAQASM